MIEKPLNTIPSAASLSVSKCEVRKIQPRTPSVAADEIRSSITKEPSNWTRLGLEAEADKDSLFCQVHQLNDLNLLDKNELDSFGAVISKIWESMYVATRDNPGVLNAISLPNSIWSWADLHLAAEDREHSVFGVSRKLKILGLWPSREEKALQNVMMTVGRKLLVANSEADTMPIVASERSFSHPCRPEAHPQAVNRRFLHIGSQAALNFQTVNRSLPRPPSQEVFNFRAINRSFPNPPSQEASNFQGANPVPRIHVDGGAVNFQAAKPVPGIYVNGVLKWEDTI